VRKWLIGLLMILGLCAGFAQAETYVVATRIGVDFKRTRPSHLRDVLRAGAGIGNVGDRHVELDVLTEGYERVTQATSTGFIFEVKIAWANFANNKIAAVSK